MKHILVIASTFPAAPNDPVPAFVKDQIIALKKEYPELTFSVLAPHDARSKTASFTSHDAYNEYRFHYTWPRRFEKLAGRGIMPQLKKNPMYYLLIPLLFIGEYIALRRLVRTLKPDILYAHWFTPQGIVGGLVARHYNVPLVTTSHALDVAVWHKIPFGEAIVRHFLPQSHKITAVSRRTYEKLQSFFSETSWQQLARRVKIIPMGVDVTPPSVQASEQPHALLFVGRLAEKKGVTYLLQAFAKIQSEFPNATLTIAGDGPLLNALKTEATQLKLDNNRVNFTGYISGETKLRHIAQAGIYVVPSIIASSGDAEGLPVTLMEGLAAGKICIATNESGADGIIHTSSDGFLVPQKDAEQLAEALRKALQLTPEQRRTMQAKAKQTAQQFAWPDIARAHYEFLFKD